RMPLHEARDLVDRVEVGERRAPGFDRDEQLVQPPRAFAALRALPARLVTEEARDDRGGAYHALTLVHHDDRAGAEEAPGFAERLVVHRDGHRLLGGEDGHRDAAGNDGFERSPLGNAARVLEDDLTERNAERKLVRTGPHDV